MDNQTKKLPTSCSTTDAVTARDSDSTTPRRARHAKRYTLYPLNTDQSNLKLKNETKYF